MRKNVLQWACASSLLLPLAASAAEATFNFTFQGVDNAATGQLVAEDLGDGRFLATSGDLTVTLGAAIGSYSMVPGNPSLVLSPSGTYLFDGIVDPGSDTAFTNGGVVFAGSGFEINIYSVAPGEFKFDFFTNGINTIDPTTGTVVLSAVPEVDSLLLGALGLSAVVAARVRERRQRVFSLQA